MIKTKDIFTYEDGKEYICLESRNFSGHDCIIAINLNPEEGDDYLIAKQKDLGHQIELTSISDKALATQVLTYIEQEYA